MTAQRCPNCRALNAEHADRCSLCDQELAAHPAREDEIRYGAADRAASRDDADQPTAAADAAVEAEVSGEPDTPRPQPTVRPGPVALPPTVRTMLLGAIAGAVLALIAVAAFYLFRGAARVPLIGILFTGLIGLLMPPAITLGGLLPLAAGSVLTGAMAGALLGALGVFLRAERSPWPAAFLTAVIFAALASGAYWGRAIPLVFLLALMIRAAVCGLVYGYMIWLIVCGYLEAVRPRRSG